MRLTEVDECGNWSLKGVAWKNLYVGSVITPDVAEKLYEALCKLKDYEETGVNPETVEKMAEIYSKHTSYLEKMAEIYSSSTYSVLMPEPWEPEKKLENDWKRHYADRFCKVE